MSAPYVERHIIRDHDMNLRSQWYGQNTRAALRPYRHGRGRTDYKRLPEHIAMLALALAGLGMAATVVLAGLGN